MKPYLYIDELAQLTPWSAAAIRTMMSRGIFVEGDHYHRPRGRGGRPIFSWAAITKFIEGTKQEEAWEGIPFAGGVVIIDDDGQDGDRHRARDDDQMDQ